MSADGYVQVPPSSTGAKIDGASVDVAGNTVIRQRVVLADNSASAQFAVITSGALLVQPNAVAISGTAIVAVSGNVGINGISATVLASVTSHIPINISNTPSVVLATGAANIGIINNISATVTTVISNFVDASGNNRNVVDSVNTALRVNVVAGAAAGVSQVDDTTFSTGAAAFIPVGAVFSDTGTGQSASASHAAALRMTGFRALHVNIRDASGNELGGTNSLRVNIAGYLDASGQNRILVDSPSLAMRVNLVAASVSVLAQVTSMVPINISNTPSVVLATGTNNIGTLNGISATVQVQIQTPFTVNNISRTVEVTVSTPFTINAISATVTVTTANPYILNIASQSHGPRMVQISTSATATLIAAPGAGFHIYVTSLQVSNIGTVNTSAQIGWSGSAALVTMAAAANGGGFVINFDPPWKVNSNEAVTIRVDPNTTGNVYFNANFFVST